MLIIDDFGLKPIVSGDSQYWTDLRPDGRTDRLLLQPELRDAAASRSVHDPKTGKRLVFLTNNFVLPALTISELYRCRRKVELFFKWIKQHLRIKQIYGSTQNAVKTQIWTAISTYVLVAIVKKRLKIQASLYEMLQILSLTILSKPSWK